VKRGRGRTERKKRRKGTEGKREGNGYPRRKILATALVNIENTVELTVKYRLNKTN